MDLSVVPTRAAKARRSAIDGCVGALTLAWNSERADPERDSNQKSAHRHKRQNVLKQVGHQSLLYWICIYFVLFLFHSQSKDAIDSGVPDKFG
jgi:hypothetical protein